MKTKRRKISSLKRAEYNPRYMTASQREALKESLVKFGMVKPIILNINPKRKDILIGGHQRLDIWEELGNTYVYCIELNLSEKEERELNIRLNKNGGEFDIKLLQEHFEVEELKNWGFESYEIGLHEFEIEDSKTEAERAEKIEVEDEEEGIGPFVAIGETEDFIYLGIELTDEGATAAEIQEIKDRYYPNREFWEFYPTKKNFENTGLMRHLVSPKGEKMPKHEDITFLDTKIYWL